MPAVRLDRLLIHPNADPTTEFAMDSPYIPTRAGEPLLHIAYKQCAHVAVVLKLKLIG